MGKVPIASLMEVKDQSTWHHSCCLLLIGTEFLLADSCTSMQCAEWGSVANQHHSKRLLTIEPRGHPKETPSDTLADGHSQADERKAKRVLKYSASITR